MKELRWLIAIMFHHGKRAQGRTWLEIGGARASFRIIDGRDFDVGFVLKIETTNATVDHGISLHAPYEYRKTPPDIIPRFDLKMIETKYDQCFDRGNLPLYWEAMEELQQQTGVRLAQRDDRIFAYWAILYGEVQSKVGVTNPYPSCPVFLSTFMAARLIYPDLA